ncbi:MAG: hypothetical protein ACK5LK_05695 [Chthoniobacterales bacterium]
MKTTSVFILCTAILLAAYGVALLLVSRNNQVAVEENITVTYLEGTTPSAD